MNQAFVHPINQLVHCTVRIECRTASGQTSVGTGYFVSFCKIDDKRSIPCIVTNRHVIKDAIKGSFFLTRIKPDGTPDIGNKKVFSIDNFESFCIGHPDASIDLAIFPVGPILNHTKSLNEACHFITLDTNFIASDILLQELSYMEDIIMIGYPIGLWDATHNLPIIRRGITATHARLPHDGKPEFLIDAACFPGSSGSPVFLANIGSYLVNNGTLYTGTRVALLGTLYAGPQFTADGKIDVVNVPTKQEAVAKSKIPMNLGMVIQASQLLDFEPILQKLRDKKA